MHTCECHSLRDLKGKGKGKGERRGEERREREEGGLGMSTGNPWVTLGLPVPIPAGLPGRTTGMVGAGGFVKPYGLL